MVVVKLMGGLGNQLFQYATGRALARHVNSGLKLDPCSLGKRKPGLQSELDHFRINASYVTPHDLRRVSFPRNGWSSMLRGIAGFRTDIACYAESGTSFDSGLFHTEGDVYLDGYWQSEKYFLRIRDALLNELAPAEQISPPSLAVARSIQRQGTAVSLHVRRGDFFDNPTVRDIHYVCAPSYYHRCLEFIGQRFDNPRVYVFSDDIPWTKANLRFHLPVNYVDHNGSERDHEDLWLMSQCRHHVISNSSFGWWGAWLNSKRDKQVFAPGQWYRPSSMQTPDIYPAGWERVPTRDAG